MFIWFANIWMLCLAFGPPLFLYTEFSSFQVFLVSLLQIWTSQINEQCSGNSVINVRSHCHWSWFWIVGSKECDYGYTQINSTLNVLICIAPLDCVQCLRWGFEGRIKAEAAASNGPMQLLQSLWHQWQFSHHSEGCCCCCCRKQAWGLLPVHVIRSPANWSIPSTRIRFPLG